LQQREREKEREREREREREEKFNSILKIIFIITANFCAKKIQDYVNGRNIFPFCVKNLLYNPDYNTIEIYVIENQFKFYLNFDLYFDRERKDILLFIKLLQ